MHDLTFNCPSCGHKLAVWQLKITLGLRADDVMTDQAEFTFLGRKERANAA